MSRKPTAQGRPDVWLHLYAAVHPFQHNSRTADRGCQPAPGLPCALGTFEGGDQRKARARCAARMRSRAYNAGSNARENSGSRAPDAAQRPFGGALLSRAHAAARHADSSVPALRRNAHALQLVRDTSVGVGCAPTPPTLPPRTRVDQHKTPASPGNDRSARLSSAPGRISRAAAAARLDRPSAPANASP